MKNKLFFKQSKPTTVKILGTVLLILTGAIIYQGGAPLNQIIVMTILVLVLLGYSISYKFNSDYDNKKHFQLFGITLFKQSLDVIYPDYISVFAATFKQGSDWGPIAALGKSSKESSYVIRLFKGNTYFTVYKSDSFIITKDKATELSELLKVKLIVKDK